jgi:hypothetical protein
MWCCTNPNLFSFYLLYFSLVCVGDLFTNNTFIRQRSSILFTLIAGKLCSSNCFEFIELIESIEMIF